MFPPSALLVRLATLLTTFAAVMAADERISFTTVDGRAFKDVAVTRTVGRKLEVVTASGAELVRFRNLPHDIQLRFFDPSMLFPPKVGDDLDFKSLDGRKFKGVLREIAPNGISIGTSDGVEKIPYSNLPPELANTFDYDADDAARYEAALRAQQQRAAAARLAAEKKAATQRAAAEKTTAKSSARKNPARTDTPMGNRGTQALGAPKLGGSGLGR
jgi:hypothetical protein